MTESSLTNIVESAGWNLFNGLLEPTPAEIAAFCREDGLRLPEASIKGADDFLSGGLHRWDHGSIDVIFFGPTNCGKTVLSKLAFNEEAVRKRIGLLETPDGEIIDILEDEDTTDKTKAIIRVPFDGGFCLWDMPGVYGDKPIYSNMTRALLGLGQQGPSVSEVDFIDAGILPLKSQHILVSQVREILPKDVIIVFLVDLTMTPLGYMREVIKQDLSDLRQLYGEHLIVVGSFADKYYNVWDKPTREERSEIWKDVLGTDIIEYSGKTKANLTEVIRRILRAGGYEASDLLPYLTAEAKGSRLQHSLHNLSLLLSSGITGSSTQNDPYPDLQRRLLVTCALHLQISYSVSEETWLALNGDLRDIISQEGKVLDYETVRERRKASGFFQTIGSWFGKKYHRTVTNWQIDVLALAEVCAALYGVIHELEKIESPIIEASKAKQWFASEFVKRNVAATIENSESESLQLKLEDVWVDMFREHHRNTLDLATRLGTLDERTSVLDG